MRSARLALAPALLAAAAAACGAPDDRVPDARDQRVATGEDQAVTFRLDADDPDGDPLSWAATPPAHGTLTLDGDLATYTPAPDFAGTDLVEVVVSDGERSARAFVVVDVAAAPDAPRLRPDTFPATEDEPLYLADEGMLANDVDPDGDRLQVVDVKPIAGGTIALGDGEVVFTPARDWYGMARFAYTVSDGHDRASSEVVLRVGGVEDLPVLTDDVVTTDEDQPLVLPPPALLRNDVDPDGDSLMITEVDDPVGGTVELQADGAVRFVPAPDFHGTAGFLYRAGDGFDEREAHVTVVVGSVDDLPVPGRFAVVSLEDMPVSLRTGLIVDRATDGDGDPLLITAVDQPLQGTVVLLGDRIRFTPTPDATGAAGFRYLLSDGAHERAGWVEITLSPVDDPPVALGQAVALTAGGTVAVKLGGRDVDSAPLVAAVTEPPAHGTLTESSTGELGYRPDAGFTGEDSLAFVVEAGGVTSAPARILFEVAAAE